MSELSREEALVAAAVWMATSRTWESCKEDARGAIYSNRPASAEIRTALAGGGGGEKAERRFWEEVRRRDNEIVKYLTELGAANTAFHAAWVSRADHRALESRLAAAEKRAEEAEAYVAGLQLTIDEQRKNMAGFIAERDAALARVKELEEEGKRLFDQRQASMTSAWQANLALAHEINALEVQLATIRDAAGAQP